MSSITDRTAGLTIARAFLDTARAHPDVVALRERDGEGWRSWTWSQVADEVARVAAGLRGLGVGPGDRVVLMMPNRQAFHVLDVATLMLGATPVSIYNSSAPDQIEYLVGHSGATVGIVGDDSFLARFAPVRGALADLRTLGVVDPGEADHDVTYAELLAADPLDLDEAARIGGPDDLATIIYTSGTTGPPKGVMITNANATFMAHSLKELLAHLGDTVGKRLVSYLPMAHIAERVTSHYQQILWGFEVTCCPNPGDIAAYAAQVRPHIMFGVPRVWEKIHGAVMAGIDADPEKAQKFAEALAVSRDIALRLAWGTATDEDRATFDFLDEVAFRGIRELLGLDELVAAISGAAPIRPDLLAWYRGIGVPMSEVYGLSENTGGLAWTPERIKPGTVGQAVPGTEVRIADDGEVLTRGPHVFAGYLDDPDKTAETVIDGWLHTGDIGELDDDGYLRIVDRKKELIITAGGKNVSPANLETALKQIPLVGQAAAVGDKRPFVAALVVLDPDVAPVWAKQHDIAYETLDDLARDPRVIAAIEERLPEVMAGFSNAEAVKKVLVLGEEWLPDSDLLTPTSKLKRRGVNARFAAEIDALYA